MSHNCDDRKIQTTAIFNVTKQLETSSKCIVKMFCGTGKSRVIKKIIINQNKLLSVIVFPSLALIRQFTSDYLKDIDTKMYELLNVSSEKLNDIQSTTEPKKINKFINNSKTKKQNKIICVTYQSLNILLDNLSDTKIGIACFDEAHRTTSLEYKKLIYDEEYLDKYEKRVFFTATPVNANGVTMFDSEYGDCGSLACEYTYLQGLRDSILSLFELRIDIYTQNTLANMYECIARAILTTGNTRVLTFHSEAAADSDLDTSVLRFVNKDKFVEAFHSVCAKEFPDKMGKFIDKYMTFKAITAETKNKDAILSAFDSCSDDEIYIVSSCRTIGEGVDTKKANMCVFVDPKSSPKDIIQNIGRICRKVAGSDRQPTTVLIPVCIEWNKYVATGDNAEAQDKLIREQLNDRENGDYNAIMCVCAALKQEDPELYDLCLKYTNNFTETERKHALEEQGFCILDEEDIDEIVENGEKIEIHTNNIEQSIIYLGFEGKDEDESPIQRFYKVDMETMYHRIVPIEGCENLNNKRLNPPKATNRPRMNIHINDEIKLLWKIGDITLREKFGSGVLECEVERIDNDEKWKENHRKMCEFINTKSKAPLQYSKDLIEKQLATWIGTQKTNYNPKGSEFSKYIMKNSEIWKIWVDTLADEKYSNLLVLDLIQDWKNKHLTMCEFIDTKSKAPSKNLKDLIEKRLGSWIGTQKTNYDPKGSEFSKYIMKNPEIWKIWVDTLTHEKYSIVLADPEQDWKNKHQKMYEFIDTKSKAPSICSKDLVEKQLGSWIRNQKTNYDSKSSEFSKQIMKNPEIWKIWTDTLANEKYSNLLVLDLIQDWKNKHRNMCKFIDTKNKAPSNNSKDLIEKQLVNWIGTQKTNYDPKGFEFSKNIMKTSEIWKIWSDILADEKYSDMLSDQEKDWKNKHRNMYKFIDTKRKLPSTHSKDLIEKTLANWIGTQKKKYDLKGAEFSKYIMKNPEIWQIWNDTIADKKYSDALSDPEQDWKENHLNICEFIKKNGKVPSQHAKDLSEKKLANWIGTQKKNYDPKGSEFSKQIMNTNPEIWQIWTDTLADEKYSDVLADPEQDWKNIHQNICEFIDIKGKSPSNSAKDHEEKKLAAWIGTQKTKYDPKSAEFSKYIMKKPEIWKIWTKTLADPKYSNLLKKAGIQENKITSSSSATSIASSHSTPLLPKISKKSHLIPNPSFLECSSSSSNLLSKRVITDSPYKLTGREWSIQKSTTTHEKLKSNPAEWHTYHTARDISFQGYIDQSQIPRNRVITHLANKIKHKLRILDLGCGRNNIAQHFLSEKKFTIQGYDHVVEEGSTSRIGNISDLTEQEEDENADICIYSQSLMGSDWNDYLTEGYRMLRYNGEFIVSEHIKMLDNVRVKLERLGCKVESIDANLDMQIEDDKVLKWFLLIARKV